MCANRWRTSKTNKQVNRRNHDYIIAIAIAIATILITTATVTNILQQNMRQQNTNRQICECVSNNNAIVCNHCARIRMKCNMYIFVMW